MVDDVDLAGVIARIAAANSADPECDDLTVPLAVELADAQSRITSLESELAEAREWIERRQLIEAMSGPTQVEKAAIWQKQADEYGQAADNFESENARLLTVNANAMDLLAKLLTAYEDPNNQGPDHDELIMDVRAALAGHEQAGAGTCDCLPWPDKCPYCGEDAPTMTAEPIFGGTEFCGHSMMRAICPTCSPASPGKGAE